MADTKISALSAASALAGTEAIPVVQSGATVKTTPADLKTYLGTGPKANYVTGRYYLPRGIASVSNGSTQSVNTIRMFPGYVDQSVTIDQWVVKPNTAPASTANCTIYVYANDPATNKPTGTPLHAASGTITAATTAMAITASYTIPANTLLWFGETHDVSCALIACNSVPLSTYGIGAAAAATLLVTGGSIGFSYVSLTGSPDLTGVSFTETSGSSPLVAFRKA